MSEKKTDWGEVEKRIRLAIDFSEAILNDYFMAEQRKPREPTEMQIAIALKALTLPSVLSHMLSLVQDHDVKELEQIIERKRKNRKNVPFSV